MVSKGRRIEKKDLEVETRPPPENCPRCKSKLTRGSLLAFEQYHVDRFVAPAVKVYPDDPHDPAITFPEYEITVLACKNCGWTELHTNFGKVERL